MRNKLPTFKDSPAFNYFRHWVSDDGLIDAVDARIYYNLGFSDNGGLTTKDVAVSFFPKNRMQKLGYAGHPLYEEQHAAYRGRCGYTYHSGNGYDEWMQNGDIKSPPPHPEDTGCNVGYGPTEDFEGLKWFGYENIEYAKRALEQFGFIRECVYARDGSIDPRTLVMTVDARKRRAEFQNIKSKIFAEEKERCVKDFKEEIKRLISTGEIRCPKNVDMLFTSMLLNGHVAKTNPGSLEFKERWEKIRKKVISERDFRIKQRESEISHDC
jgi:hypothetical protein